MLNVISSGVGFRALKRDIALAGKASNESAAIYIDPKGTTRISVCTEANDGTVMVASELSMPIQRQARHIMGFDESHTSILESAEVAAQLNAGLVRIGHAYHSPRMRRDPEKEIERYLPPRGSARMPAWRRMSSRRCGAC